MKTTEKPIKTAFEVRFFGGLMPHIVYADSEADAICQFRVLCPENLTAKRCPEEDLFAPVLDECLEGVSKTMRRILLKAHTEAPYPGFYDRFFLPKGKHDLRPLIERGLVWARDYRPQMGPSDIDYFIITKRGRRAAISMLPRKRGENLP